MMGARGRRIVIPIAVGVDTSTDPQHSEGLSRAENVVFPRKGAARKRSGQERTGIQVLPAQTGRRMCAVNGVAAAVADRHAVAMATIATPYGQARYYNWQTSEPGGTGTFSTARGSNHVVRRRALSSSPDGFGAVPCYHVDAARGTSVEVVAYSQRIDVTASTGSAASAYGYDGGVERARCFALPDGTACAVFLIASSSQVYFTRWSGQGVTLYSAAIAGAPLPRDASAVLDAVLVGANIYAVYATTANTVALITIPWAAPAGATFSAIASPGVAVEQAVGLIYIPSLGALCSLWGIVTGGNLDVYSTGTTTGGAVAWAAARMFRFAAGTYAQALHYVTGIAATLTQGEDPNAKAMLYAGVRLVTPAGRSDSLRMTEEVEMVVSGGVASTAARTMLWDLQLCAKPLARNDTWYLPCYRESWGVPYVALQPDAACIEVFIRGPGTTLTIERVARALIGTARNPPVRGSVSECNSVATSYATAAGGIAFPALFAPGATASATESVGAVILEVDPSGTGQIVEDGDVAYLPGAAPTVLSQTHWHEHGFSAYPCDLTVTIAAGAGLTASSQYSWRAIYEAMDAAGRVIWSEPSTALAQITTPAATQTATVSVYGQPHTDRYADRTRLALYRTLANGSTYYRVSEQTIGASVGLSTFTDATTDTVLSSRAQLYTSGGALAHVRTPPWHAGTLWQGRLAVVSDDDGALYYSLPANQERALAMSDVLRVPLALGDTPTALTTLGDRLIIFTARSTWALEGRLADARGQGETLGKPYLVNPIVGCVEPRSIARVPQGVAFLAQGKFWLLAGDGSMAPIGDRVRFYTETYAYHDAALSAADQTVVWFSSTGPALAWNTTTDQWSTWSTSTADAACSASGEVWRVDATGYAYHYAPALYADIGGFFKLALESPWIGVADDESIEEVEIDGYAPQAHTLNVAVAYDHEPAWITVGTYPVSTAPYIWGAEQHYADPPTLGAEGTSFTVRVAMPRTRCAAFRLRLYDSHASASKGPEITAIKVRVAGSDALRRVSVTRQVGA